MSTEDEGSIVPITEWPVTEFASTSETDLLTVADSMIKDGDTNLSKFSLKKSKPPAEHRKFNSRFQPYSSSYRSNNSEKLIEDVQKEQVLEPRDLADDPLVATKGQKVKAFDSEGEEVTNVDIKIAKWWRRYNRATSRHSWEDFPKDSNANTTLHHITRLPECHQFLLDEKKQLLKRTNFSSPTAETYAALASVEDRLGNFGSGLVSIKKALNIHPDNSNFLWLQEKLSRQCLVEEKQEKAKSLLAETGDRKMLPFLQVQRVSGRDVSITQFQERFVNKNEPVILTGVVDKMTKQPFDFALVKTKAGHKSVRVKKVVQSSVEWARLEDGNLKSVRQFIEEVEAGATSEYLFDWSLPLQCPDLAQDISLPPYFQDNLLLLTSSGSLYQASWPSLFVAPKGAVSNLHIDAFASHFWMALFQGEKRWTFFSPDDTPLLYPKYFHSLDPVFEVDLANPDLDKYPLVSLAQARQCVLKPGELLFVPAGSPHHVENLTVSLAISSNYVNMSNFDKVCKELSINGLLDPRARDLLEEFQQPGFTQQARKEKRNE